MITPLINGRSYGWADITANILGTPVAGITAIKYEDDQEMQDNYGAGNRPVSRSYGNIKCTGSVTLTAEEVEALTAASPNRRIQEIPEFPIIVNYLNDDGNFVTHTLRSCRFMKNSRDVKQNDKVIEVEIPLMIAQIDW
jgi:hypothetical protein